MKEYYSLKKTDRRPVSYSLGLQNATAILWDFKQFSIHAFFNLKRDSSARFFIPLFANQAPAWVPGFKAKAILIMFSYPQKYSKKNKNIGSTVSENVQKNFKSK